MKYSIYNYLFIISVFGYLGCNRELTSLSEINDTTLDKLSENALSGVFCSSDNTMLGTIAEFDRTDHKVLYHNAAWNEEKIKSKLDGFFSRKMNIYSGSKSQDSIHEVEHLIRHCKLKEFNIIEHGSEKSLNGDLLAFELGRLTEDNVTYIYFTFQIKGDHVMADVVFRFENKVLKRLVFYHSEE